MIELLLDTSYIGLNIGLSVDGNLIDKIEIEAIRKQSEITMPQLDELFKKHNLNPLSVNRVIITEGPGSYTGLRIAMTIAKTMAVMIPCELYTVNTLYGYVHPSVNKGLAIMDARSKRAYVALFEKGEITLEPQVLKLEDIVVEKDVLVFGDGHLINQEAQSFSMIDNMLAHRHHWHKVEDVDALVPLYLKSNEAYGN